MKKLMFAAFAAAMIGGVEAAGYNNCFGVYDFAATLKTTKGVKANLKAKSNDCLAEGTYYVRKQATVKVAGLIWGCDCASIATPAPFTGFRYVGFGPFDGSAFWNTTDKVGFDVFGDADYNTLTWQILNRIDTTAKKTEGLWTLELAYADDDGNPVTSFNLMGAGFGTAAGELEGECGNSHVYIPSISGYAVGTRSYTCKGDGPASVYPCADPQEGEQFGLIWWELCDCGDGVEDTIAYGSWSIKFNQSITNKGAKNAGMNETVYTKFPKYILPQMLAYDPDPDPTECDVLEAAVNAAKKDVATAKDGVDAVSFKSLTAAVATAAEAYKNATNAQAAASVDYDNKTWLYNIAVVAAKDANKAYTNTQIKVKLYADFGGSSTTTITTNGYDKLTAIVPTTGWQGIAVQTNGVDAVAKAVLNADTLAKIQKLDTDAKAAVTAAEAKVTTAESNKKTAASTLAEKNADVATAKANLLIAENNLKDINLLQIEAEKALEKAEAAYAAAEKAFENAGCGTIN